MTSPIPIVSIRNAIGKLIPYPNFNTKGTIRIFDAIGGSTQRNGLFLRNKYVKKAPIKVARLPNIISGKIAPPNTFPTRQPINNPGIAAGVKAGRMVKASAIRTCTSPKENGAKI